VVRSGAMAATSTQKLAVWLAFIAAALSFTAVALTASRTGRIEATPLGGGLLMLALGIAGVAKLRRG
jgi:FtsH-binding integral membrane protein